MSSFGLSWSGSPSPAGRTARSSWPRAAGSSAWQPSASFGCCHEAGNRVRAGSRLPAPCPSV
eukprot:1107476-Prorocentrum_lima.AAC.1